MGKIFVQMSVSLDGFIEDRDGGLDWFAGSPIFDSILTRTILSIGGVIFGRKAYEMGADFWPNADTGEKIEPETREQIRLMNALPKYVLSHSKLNKKWANCRPVSEEELPGLRAKSAKPIALFAGAETAQIALGHGAVDELRLARVSQHR